jgi:hypothetical protein
MFTTLKISSNEVYRRGWKPYIIIFSEIMIMNLLLMTILKTEIIITICVIIGTVLCSIIGIIIAEDIKDNELLEGEL